MSDIDVLVVGGGISGLAMATSLVHQGVSVELWESSPKPGGKIETDTGSHGYVTERAANMVMNFRPEVNQFIEQSNLLAKKSVLAPVVRRYMMHGDKLVAVPTKLAAMISSPVWTLPGKLRLLAEPLIRKGGHEDETVSEFITRRVGREVLENAMEPFVSGVLASDPDLANAYSVLPRMTGLEKRFGSLTLGIFMHKFLGRRTATPREAFSFNGGMATLVKSLLDNPGIRFRPEHTAVNLLKRGSDWQVTGTTNGKDISLTARQVVLCVPANAAAQLLSPFDHVLAALLRGIQYAPVAVVHTGFDRHAIKHPLDGTGFLIPRRAGTAATGCLWMSSLFPNRAPQGRVLLTNYLGGARLPDAVEWDDERSVSEIMKVISPLLDIRDGPEMVRIDRHHKALPLYHGNYYGRMQMITERLQKIPGIQLEANYRGGVAVRDRIVCAHIAAKRMAEELATSQRPGRCQVSLFPAAALEREAS
ncbi:MAG: protoporphyrinogen oxidase [Proteobacteria bacterium]|nr:protoporphyrinogen oxidase [Pseudomonadota bacterium]